MTMALEERRIKLVGGVNDYKEDTRPIDLACKIRSAERKATRRLVARIANRNAVIRRLLAERDQFRIRVADLEARIQFGVETGVGLLKPSHRVECRCDGCVGWLQQRVLELQAERDRLAGEVAENKADHDR
jgi:hypothetical protein